MAISDNLGLILRIKGDNNEALSAMKQAEEALKHLGAIASATGSRDVGGLTQSFAGLAGGLGPVGIGAAAAAASIAAVGGAAVTAGAFLFKMAETAAQFGGKIKDAADKTGLHAETLTSLKRAAEESGSSLEEVVGGISKFNKLVGEAGNGSKEAAEKLKQFGLTPRQAMEDLDGSLGKVLKHIVELPTSAQQTAAAMAAFGRSGASLLPVLKSFNGDLAELVKRTKEAGLTMDDAAVEAADRFDDSLSKLKAQAEMLAVKFGTGLLPAMTKVTEKMSNWVATNQTKIEQMGRTTGVVVDDMIGKLGELASWIERNPRTFMALFGGLGAASQVYLEGAAQRGRNIAPEPAQPKIPNLEELKAEAEAREAAAKKARTDRKALIEASIEAWKAFYDLQAKSIQDAFNSTGQLSVYLTNISKSFEDAKAKNLSLLDQQYAIDSFGKTGDELNALTIKYQTARNQLIASSNQELNALNKKAYDDDLKNLDSAYEKQKEVIASRLAEARAKIEESYRQGKMSQREYYAALKANSDDETKTLLMAEFVYLNRLQTAWKRYKSVAGLSIAEKTKIEGDLKIIEDRIKEVERRLDNVNAASFGPSASDVQGPMESGPGGENAGGHGGIQGSAEDDKSKGTQGPLGVWAEEWKRLKEEFGKDNSVVTAIGKIKDAFADMFGNLKAALTDAIANWLLYGDSIGKALKKALAAELAHLASLAALKALEATAMGFFYLATLQFAQAGNAFTSAAVWGALAVAAGAGARAMAKGSFQQQSGTATGQTSSSRNTGGQGLAYSGQQATTIDESRSGAPAFRPEIVISDRSGMFSQLFEAEIRNNSKVRGLIIQTANS